MTREERATVALLIFGGMFWLICLVVGVVTVMNWFLSL